MATLIQTDHTTRTVYPKNGKTFTLAELQTYVKGYIEAVYPNEQALVFNEEGKLQNLPMNAVATHLARTAGIAPDDFIVGDALLCTMEEFEGEEEEEEEDEDVD